MSRARISLEPGLILHQRPYRETSRLLEVFTRDQGRVGLVARGVRGARSGRAALLQPLRPLLLSWSESGELGTLTGAEAGGAPLDLAGERLVSAWYVNELVLRGLPRRDPHPDLYTFYLGSLSALADEAQPVQPVLREFEMQLLEDLGYGLAHAVDLAPSARYDYCEHGPQPAPGGRWSGAHLIAIDRRDWAAPGVLPAARHLLRERLSLLLGGKPLQTPQLLESLRRLQARPERL